MNVEELKASMLLEKSKYRSVSFRMIEGKMSIRHVTIEANGFGNIRVLSGAKVCYNGDEVDEAVAAFNERAKQLEEEARND